MTSRGRRPVCPSWRTTTRVGASPSSASALGSPSSELWSALASAYRTAHDVAIKLGFYDLATVALDRMDWAAYRASDPLISAMRQYMRALVYFREGEHSIGLRLIGAGHNLIGPSYTSLESRAVAGQLHLGATVIAARAERGQGKGASRRGTGFGQADR